MDASVQLFLAGNYNHVVLRYWCQAPPLNTLRTWAGKVQEGEPLEGYGTNSVLSCTEEETILKFIKELKYEAAVFDPDTIAALGRTVAERSRGPGLAPVLDGQWAANLRRRHKMGCLKKITTERLPSTVSDLALDNKWRREFLDLVEQPQTYGVRIPEGEPQSLPPWAQLGLDETPLQYAPKLRGAYAAREKQVRHYSSADKRQATATPVVNREGTVKVLQVLQRRKTGRCHARLDLPQGLPSYMHEDHAEKKCQTGDTFKRLMIKVDTEVAKDKRDHGVAQNYPCVVIMDCVGSHLDDDELKRVDDAEIRLANLYYYVARPHMYVFFGRARGESPPNPKAQTVRAHARVHTRSRPHSPRTPTAQDYEESPRTATATSPHDPVTPTNAHSSAQDRGPAQGQWWQRWTRTQLWELRKWAQGEPSLEGLVHRPRKGSVENSRLQPAGGWMPQAAWEAMLADALHPLGVHPRNLPAPQDQLYVLRRLRETLQETQRDGIRLWDITQSPAPHTHNPSPPHKRRRTDTGGTHSTPGTLRATQHDAPEPPASGATTEPRYPANHRRGAPRQALPRSHQTNRTPKDAKAQDNGHH